MKKKIITVSIIILIVILCFAGSRIITYEICKAVSENDVSKVEKLLKVPFSNIFINTPKHRAMPDEVTAEDILPIQYAAMQQEPQLIKLLIDNGADVNKRTRDMPPALKCVLSELSPSCLESVHLLIESGADMSTCRYSYTAAGFNTYTTDAKGRLVPDTGLQEDCFEIYKEIVENTEKLAADTINAYDDLRAAVASNNYKIVKYIVTKKTFDLDMQYDDTDTILFYVGSGICDKETIKIAKVLIAAGADKTAAGSDGRTAYECYEAEPGNRYSTELKELLKQ